MGSVIPARGGRSVLAVGRIDTRAQMVARLSLGAAVWCGSLWLNSFEDITPLAIKQRYLDAGTARS